MNRILLITVLLLGMIRLGESLTDRWLLANDKSSIRASDAGYWAAREDFAESLSFAPVSILAAIMMWRSAIRKPPRWLGVSSAWYAMSLVHTSRALLLVVIAPAVLTGASSQFKWRTFDDYKAAHVNLWSAAMTVVIIPMTLWTIRRRKNAA